eukprot:CAMPEP_0175589426 /NCGR_PEP_ID=MMETSP0096-20121207/51807_1 /TAXON_ID=311494 /ORGANISM="Alexandrium monilatum, Strain CCMP3105" /LENGTH=77 /DNA_ID=CAMNT_0016893451 /DNA_START=11 /DNA_END=240 /DNA_ORIENTATION=+
MPLLWDLSGRWSPLSSLGRYVVSAYEGESGPASQSSAGLAPLLDCQSGRLLPRPGEPLRSLGDVLWPRRSGADEEGP